MSLHDPTIAERSRRYRKRRRATARSGVGATVRLPSAATVRLPLSSRQEAAIEALIDVIEEHGERPGLDGEPVAPLTAWRAKVRAMARGQTARQDCSATSTARCRTGSG